MNGMDPEAMPPPFRKNAAGQVELRQGGGWVSLFGLPFFIAGVASQAKWFSTPTTAVIGLIFLIAGGVVAFGRRWTIFDAGQQCVIRRWGLLLPMRQSERRLADFDAVVIAVEQDSESADRFPVSLRSPLGKDFKVSTSAKFEESRERADFLCRFLALKLVDRSTDHEFVLSPQQAGRTFQERSGAPERVARPAIARSEVTETGGTLRIAIPARGWAATPLAAGAFIPISIAVYLFPALLRSFPKTDSPDLMQLAPAAFVLLAFGGLPLCVVVYTLLIAFKGRTVVTASPSGIAIERRGAWRTKTMSIPIADILGLDYSTIDSIVEKAKRSSGHSSGESDLSRDPAPGVSPIFNRLKKLLPSKGIIVKSRHGLFTFGEGLDGAELQYLLSITAEALGGNH